MSGVDRCDNLLDVSEACIMCVCRERAATADAMLAGCKRRALAQTLQGWAVATAEAQRLRGLLARGLERAVQRRSSAALWAWRGAAVDARRLRWALQRALHRQGDLIACRYSYSYVRHGTLPQGGQQYSQVPQCLRRAGLCSNA